MLKEKKVKEPEAQSVEDRGGFPVRTVEQAKEIAGEKAEEAVPDTDQGDNEISIA